MEKEKELLKIIEKGEKYRKFLSCGLIDEVFEDLTHSFHRSWEGALDKEVRDEWWFRVRALKDVHRTIQAVIQQGEDAEVELSILKDELRAE